MGRPSARLLALAALVVLPLVPAPAGAAPGTMTLAPTAGFTGTTPSLVVTSRAAYPGATGVLQLTPTAEQPGGAPFSGSYTGTATAGGPTGTRWNVALPLADPTSGTPAAPGLYDAALLVGDRAVEECTGCFTVLTRGAPTVTAAGLVPRRALPGETVPLLVAGSSFADQTLVEFVEAGKPSTTVLAGAATSPQGADTDAVMTRDLTVDPGAALGHRDVRVTNTDGRTGTCKKCFTVTVPADKVEPTGSTNDVKRVVTLSVPAALPRGTRLRLVWTGPDGPDPKLDLTAAATLGVAEDTSTLVSTVDFTGATPGLDAYRAAYVLPDGSVHGCEGLCRFTVRQGAPPEITALTGLSKAKTALRTLALTGTGFTRGTTVVSDDAFVAVQRSTYTSPTSMSVVVRVAAGASGDPVVFQVANPDGQSSQFTSDPLEPGPAGTAVSVAGSAEEDPDPTRAPEAPTLRAAAASVQAQQSLQLTGRADAGSSVDLFATTTLVPTPRLVRTISAVADDGEYSFVVAPLSTTRYSAVSRNSFGRRTSLPLSVQVRPAVTLTATRLGALQQRFAGGVFPYRANQLVTVYDTSRTPAVALGQTRTRPDGTWRLDRRFLRPAALKVQARTGADAVHASGRSVVRNVRTGP